MGDSDSSLKIDLVIDLIGRGKAAEAIELLQAIKGTANDGGNGLRNLGKSTEEGGEKFKLFANHAGEVKKVISELTIEFPLAGYALKAFFSPIGAFVTGAILLFRSLKDHIREINQSLDAMEAESRTPLSNFSNSAAQAAASASELASKMDEIRIAAGNIETGTQKAIAAIRALETAELELNNSDEAKKIAAINADEAAGKIGPTQAITARQKVRDEAARNEIEIKNKADRDEIARMQDEKAKLEAERKKIGYQPLTPAEEERQKARIKSAPEDADAMKKSAMSKELVDAIAKAQKEADAALEGYGYAKDRIKIVRQNNAGQVPEAEQDLFNRAEKRYTESIGNLDELTGRQQKFIDTGNKIQADADKLSQEAERRQASAAADKEISGKIDNLTREIAQRNEMIKQVGPLRDQAAENRTATQHLETNTALFKEHSDLQRKLAGFQSKDALTAEDIKEVTSTIRELNQILPMLIGGETNAGTIRSLREEQKTLSNLIQQVKQIQKQLNYPNGGT